MRLIINNSECKLESFTAEQFRQIKDILSYEIDAKAAYFSKSWSRKRYLIDKRGTFPTGLLYLVESWASTTKTPLEVVDKRVVPPESIDFDINLDHTPYPEQLDAVLQASWAKRGIIRAPTGTGKSVIAALLCYQFKIRTLVVVPSLELKKQLTATLRKAFGSSMVGNLTVDEAYPIAVENIDALDPNRALKKTGLIIIDEFHHAAAETYRKLNKKAWVNVYCRIGLSATPWRTKDSERLLLESVLSNTIYTLEYKRAVDNGYIVPVEAFYLDVPLSKLKGNPKNWASVYSELIVNNTQRNDLIKSLLHKFSQENKSTLCLVKEINHGENLSRISGTPFVNGEDDDSRYLIDRISSNQIKSLIGTEGVVGEGVDTKAVEFVIIAGLGKAKGRFMQQVGRGVRKYPGKSTAKIIIFRDLSHKWTKAHFQAQCKVLREEYDVIPKKLSLE